MMSVRGFISKIRPALNSATAAETAKAAENLMPWSRIQPSTRSRRRRPDAGKIHHPVAGGAMFGRAIWQRIGMLLQSKNPQPRPNKIIAAMATPRLDA